MRSLLLVAPALALGIVVGQRIPFRDPAPIRSRVVWPTEAAHLKWFQGVFGRAGSVHVGSTRAQLEKVYQAAGGIQSIPTHLYTFKELDLLGVDVRYRFVKPSTRDAEGRVNQPESPSDKIESIGPVTVAYPAYD